jgi:Haemolysin XhlA
MSNYSDRELIEAIYDVRDRVTRIEEKLNRTEGLSDKVEQADDKATEALLKCTQLESTISEMKTNTKWALGSAFTIFATILGIIIEKLFL